MNLLSHYTSRQKHENKSDKWVELSIVKEYLIIEQESIRKEIDHVEELAIKQYMKNILITNFKQRLTHIDKLLQDIIQEIKNNN